MKDLKSSTERTNISFNLDGTELYGKDGQTVADITELDTNEIIKILEG